MELAAAKAAQESIQSGSPSSDDLKNTQASGKRRYLMVVGINTAFSSRKRRDSVRATWMPQGRVDHDIVIFLKRTIFVQSFLVYIMCWWEYLKPWKTGEKRKKLEEEKGIIIRFVIGHRYEILLLSVIFATRSADFLVIICQKIIDLLAKRSWMSFLFLMNSATSGGILDRAIEAEDKKHGDFLRLVAICVFSTEFSFLSSATHSLTVSCYLHRTMLKGTLNCLPRQKYILLQQLRCGMRISTSKLTTMFM